MENQTKPVSFFRFEDLRVYHKSLDYFNWIAEQTKSANNYELKVVVKPLMNASLKISLNIAEGSSRHKVQFVAFLKDAKTAVRECVVIATLANKIGVFSDEQFNQSNDTLVEMTKMIGAMIVSLQRNTMRDENEVKPDFNSSTEIEFEY
ncbi:MAG: four helix bundle protein [Bacteroidetes bacterium]|nr:four helix bundle protein [Bacteroidota bacterium]